MTNLTDRHQTELLRHAAERASLAPSIHNTQPWRFVLASDSIEVHADLSRQLRVLDPSARQLSISCGCALFNVRIAMAAANREVVVERFPDPEHPTLVARVRVTGGETEWSPLTRLDPQIERRRTNRRRFETDPILPELRYEIMRAIEEEDSLVAEIRTDEQRNIVADLSQQADAVQNADPAYREELRAWTSDDLKRRDGVPATVVPHVSGRSEDQIPIRDFDTHGRGWLPTHTASGSNEYLFLLGSAQDNHQAWLRTGEALQRLWLEITRYDFVASLLTQVVEVSITREMLRKELGLTMFPHLLVRVGRAPVTPAAPRRDVEDMMMTADDRS